LSDERLSQGNLQDIDIDRLGDKIGRFILKTHDGQVHGPVAGCHDNFGVRIFLFNLAQQLDAVHARHFDIGQHNRGPHGLKSPQGFFAVFGRVHLIAYIGQSDLENIADILFIVYYENFIFHLFAPGWGM
jgi:hypothetical protein